MVIKQYELKKGGEMATLGKYTNNVQKLFLLYTLYDLVEFDENYFDRLSIQTFKL